MNCPNCELPTLPEQKFCRSCGASLQMTTQPLAGPASVFELQRTPPPVVTNHQRTNSLMLWGFILMFAGAAIGVIGKKLMQEDVITVLGVLISLAGMFLTVYPFLSPARPKHEVSPSAESEPLTQPQAPKMLRQERNSEYVPSVTERTTDLLEEFRDRECTRENSIPKKPRP